MDVLVIFLGLTGGALILVKGRAEPIVLTALGLAQLCAGFLLLDRLYGTSTASPILAFCALTIAGYALENARLRRGGSGRPSHGATPSLPTVRRGVHAAALLVSAGALLHFYLAGAPIFSENVEVDRFQFTKSGLFGIPGRLYLYGLPLLALLITTARARDRRVVSSRISALVWLTFVTSRILGGFKGGIWEVLTIALLALLIANPRALLIPALARVRYLVLGLCAIAFAIFLSLQYATAAVSTTDRAIAYLVSRYTIGSAHAGHFVLTRGLPEPRHHSYMLDEAMYFAGQYVGLELSAGAPVLPLDKTASALIVGIDPRDETFRAPVTLGAGSSLMADVGVGIAIMIAPVAGSAYRRVIERARISPPGTQLWPFAAVIAFNTWFHNGGLVHLFINWAAVVMLLRVVFVIFGPIPLKVFPRGNRPTDLPVPTRRHEVVGSLSTTR